MDSYVVVKTLCDNKDIANKIIDTLLEKKLIAGSQMSKVSSKYWWKNTIEENIEYKLEFRTKESKYPLIEREIKKIHNYDVAEISYYELKNGSKEFLHWIDENML